MCIQGENDKVFDNSESLCIAPHNQGNQPKFEKVRAARF